MRNKLIELRDWAKAKIATGAEPPWAWYQYMKLVEVTEAILAGTDATSPTGSSQQSERNPATHLQLVDSTYRPDSVPLRQSDQPPQMPM